MNNHFEDLKNEVMESHVDYPSLINHLNNIDSLIDLNKGDIIEFIHSMCVALDQGTVFEHDTDEIELVFNNWLRNLIR